MSINCSNELGTIAVSNEVFARVIVKAINNHLYRGKVWPATSKAKIIGNYNKISPADLSGEIQVIDNKGKIKLEFNLVISFGTSIKLVTDKISEIIFDEFRKEFKPIDEIKINIVGTKSKQIARRELEVIYHNGFK